MREFEMQRGNWRLKTRQKTTKSARYCILAVFIALILVLVNLVNVSSPRDKDILARTSVYTSNGVVDCSVNVGEFTSIAIDSKDKIHISYYDATNGDLKYATNAGGEWNSRTIDSLGNVGTSTSIAVDSKDKIHISYIDRTNNDLKYATNAGGNWETCTVDSSIVMGPTSIAVDSKDSVHISYTAQQDNDDNLMYATNADGSWSMQTLSEWGLWSSIAVDSNDKIHISHVWPGSPPYDDYLLWTTNAQGPWTNDPGSWSVSVVAHQYGYDYRFTSIVVDSKNNPHICCAARSGYQPEELMYATYADGSWPTELVSPGSGYNSMAIDSKDRIHISCGYWDNWMTFLKYVTNAGGPNSLGAWTSDIVDSSIEYSSIAVDSKDNVHISYNDPISHVLKYMVISAIPVFVDNQVFVRNPPSIAIDSGDKVHISYLDYGNGDLKYATNEGGSWATSTIDSAGVVGYYSSIAIDSLDNVHISYYDITNKDLKYATNSDGSWKCYTIDSESDVGAYTSIAIDSNDKVHISYVNSEFHVKYATNAGGSWNCITLDSTAAAYSTSMTVDSNNWIYIAYVVSPNWCPRLATNAGGQWNFQTISSTGLVGFRLSVAVDLYDSVYISYYDGTNRDLKYVTNAGGSWSIFTVDSVGDVGTYPSMTFDHNNRIHISYGDVGNHDLKYATNTGGSWKCYTIDFTGYVDSENSIATDSLDRPHICYYGPPNSNLKYVMIADLPSAPVAGYNLWFDDTSDSKIVVGSHGTLRAKVTDQLGTPLEGVSVAFSSDSPGLTFAPTSAVTDGAGSATTSATSSAAGTYLVTATTTEGAFSTWSLEVEEGDTTPPTTTCSLGGTLGCNQWYVSDVSVSLTASDDSSGVASIYYSTDGGTKWEVYYTAFIVSAEGPSTIECYSVDNAGNSETPTFSSFKIDKTAPTITGSRSPEPNGNSWNNGDITVSFEASDSISGVDTVTPDATFSEEGAGQSVLGTAVDRAGNSATCEVTGINIDRTQPSVLYAFNPASPNGLNGWYVTDVTVTFTANDATSGVVSFVDTEVLGEGAGQTATRDICDLAGNLCHVTTNPVSIDKTSPITGNTLSGTIGLDGSFVSEVKVNLASSDETSGIGGIQYSLDAGAWDTYTEPLVVNIIGDHKILYHATDVAGNQEADKTVEFSVEQILAFDAASSSITAINVEGSLIIKLTDNGGNPIAGAGVSFSSSPAGLVFGTMPAYTDSSGLARIAVRSGTSDVYQVTAKTPLGAVATWTFVIYDSSGMTAGGGWFYPLDDPGSPMSGTANFGFVAKYIKGNPTGDLEFQYHIDQKLNLKSTSITWLVVSGSNAQFNGQGTLNGIGGYSFHVMAHEGTNGDTFSIKIWDANGALIHSSHNTLAGGSILVRTKSGSSVIGPVPVIGANWPAVICMLLAIMTIGLRQIVTGARMVVGKYRQKKQMENAESQGPRIEPRTRKLRMPCALAKLE